MVSRTSGKWLTSTMGMPGRRASSRRSVSATRAAHQAVAAGVRAGCSRISSVQTTPLSYASASASSFGWSPRRPEAVVVQQEQRGDGDRSAGSRPDRVGSSGVTHAEAPADLDQVAGSAPRRAAGRDRCGRVHSSWLPGTQTTLAKRSRAVRAPIRRRRPSRRRPRPPAASRVGRRPQLLDAVPVLRVRDVEVADGQQSPRWSSSSLRERTYGLSPG